MRAGSRVAVALTALLCLAGPARDAGAAITITLEWGACAGGTQACAGIGTSSIAVDYLSPGQTLRLDIYLTHDETAGLIAHTFSLNFDTDLGNELNLAPMAPVEWAGTDGNPGPLIDIYGPFNAGLPGGTVESTTVMPGRINSFESASVTTVLPANNAAYSVGTFTGTAPARYRVGQAFFTTTGRFAQDGADVFSGSFNGPYDVSSNGTDLFPPSPIIFGTASVNLLPGIPEPGVISLLGLGLVGLVLVARRRRA